MKHNFHILSLSVYPYLFYFYIGGLFSSVVLFFKFGVNFFIYFLFVVVLLMFVWFKDIVYEGLVGCHNIFVQDGFKYGMLLFIFSEFMFFFCIFWVFFDSSLVLMVDTGDSWSSLGYCFINPLGVPMLNSFILLSSAATVTWSHFSLLGNYSCLFSLVCTLLLSFYFLSIQFMEYTDSEFSISSGVYGSIFFFSTGFHGLHVIFGSIFLLVNYFRIVQNHYSMFRHLGYEFSILYWHFVDVVWLFLFVFVYWWSY